MLLSFEINRKLKMRNRLRNKCPGCIKQIRSMDKSRQIILRNVNPETKEEEPWFNNEH